MKSLHDVLSTLKQEDTPQEINFNAPEMGAFAPAFKPSVQQFLFVLNTEKGNIEGVPGFEHKDNWGGKSVLLVHFTAVVNVEGTDRKIMFQSANTFKNDRMINSSIGDLIRSLELKDAFDQNLAETGDFNEAIIRTLQAADGRAVGSAEFGWAAAFKESLTVFRTSTSKTIVPKKAGGYTIQPWPRDAQGAYCATVADPGTGQEKYPNLEITRFRIAKPSLVTA